MTEIEQPKELQPNYYAVIPADVRYAKISPNAKLLYGEISALANSKGFCWASNAYFANLYEASKDSVSRWVTELVTAGFVFVTIESGKQRHISLGVSAKMPRGIGKNAEHNNTSNITTTKVVVNSSISKEKSKVDLAALLAVLAAGIGRPTSRVTPQRIAKLTQRLKTYSTAELQKAAGIIKNSDFMVKGGHNTIDYLLRNDEKIEYWLNQESAGAPSRGYA